MICFKKQNNYLQCKDCRSVSLSGQNPGGEKSRTNAAESSSSAPVASSSQSLPCFWVPSLTPQSKPTLLKKPVSLL